MDDRRMLQCTYPENFNVNQPNGPGWPGFGKPQPFKPSLSFDTWGRQNSVCRLRSHNVSPHKPLASRFTCLRMTLMTAVLKECDGHHFLIYTTIVQLSDDCR
jgi:hypothetical protein